MILLCTDRGQHKPRRIAVGERDTGPIPWVGCVRKDRSLATQPDPALVVRYELLCATCGRHLVLRRETWLRLVDGLGETTRVDISRLPF